MSPHPALAILAARPDLFSRHGAIVATWRRRGARTYGPYYRLAYREAGRQKSIYLGRDQTAPAKHSRSRLPSVTSAKTSRSRLPSRTSKLSPSTRDSLPPPCKGKPAPPGDSPGLRANETPTVPVDAHTGPSLVQQVRQRLARLQEPLRRCRVLDRLRRRVSAALRLHKVALDRHLRPFGLHLKGFEVRGWRTSPLRSALPMHVSAPDRPAISCQRRSHSVSRQYVPKATRLRLLSPEQIGRHSALHGLRPDGDGRRLRNVLPFFENRWPKPPPSPCRPICLKTPSHHARGHPGLLRSNRRVVACNHAGFRAVLTTCVDIPAFLTRIGGAFAVTSRPTQLECRVGWHCRLVRACPGIVDDPSPPATCRIPRLAGPFTALSAAGGSGPAFTPGWPNCAKYPLSGPFYGPPVASNSRAPSACPAVCETRLGKPIVPPRKPSVLDQ
jgi:hypothetical protein